MLRQDTSSKNLCPARCAALFLLVSLGYAYPRALWLWLFVSVRLIDS